MVQSENYEPTKEEYEYLASLSEKYKDLYGMYNISEMISRVDHALKDDKTAIAKIAIIDVYYVLNRPSYFHNVFLSDETDEEWKTRVALRNGLYKLLNA